MTNDGQTEPEQLVRAIEADVMREFKTMTNRPTPEPATDPRKALEDALEHLSEAHDIPQEQFVAIRQAFAQVEAERDYLKEERDKEERARATREAFIAKQTREKNNE